MKKTQKNGLQNVTVWEPSKKQSAVLEAARAGHYRSVTATCSQASVSRKSFYAWLNDDPAFADAWLALWREHAQKAMPLIVAAMVRKAVRGDVAAARLVAELAEATRNQLVENPGHPPDWGGNDCACFLAGRQRDHWRP